jgi:hypothetical protein
MTWLERLAHGAVMDQGDVTDSDAHIAPVLEALRAAYRAGAEAMRERAERLLRTTPRARGVHIPLEHSQTIALLAYDIRALPLPGDEGTDG